MRMAFAPDAIQGLRHNIGNIIPLMVSEFGAVFLFAVCWPFVLTKYFSTKLFTTFIFCKILVFFGLIAR
jgi:hypothetical protein